MGYQILELYIQNETVLRNAEINFYEQKERHYSMTLPQHDDSLGYIVRKVKRVEDAVLDAIELEEIHKEKFKGHYRVRGLLTDCLNALSGEELEAYYAIVWNKPSSLNKARLKELEPVLVKKLCNYIVENHKNGSIK